MAQPVAYVAQAVYEPPRWLPTSKDKRMLIFDVRAYYVRRATEVENVLVDPFAAGLGEKVLQLRCASENCWCPARCHYVEANDEYHSYVITPGRFHVEDCIYNLFAICFEDHKEMVYAGLKDGTYNNVRASYCAVLNKWRRFYQPDLFEDLNYFKSKGNKILREQFPPLPTLALLAEIELPFVLTRTLHTIEPFLLFKHSWYSAPDATHPAGRLETIIVLATAEGFRALCMGKTAFADGTFKVCPDPFYQLYILFTPNGNYMRPCCYCLLPRKTQETYEMLFGMLYNMANERNHPVLWEKFRCDYEIAAISAARLTVPGITVTGCFFHFCSAIYKKAMELGLSIPYRDPATRVKRAIKKCMALAFLPPANIAYTFGEIQVWYAAQVVPAPRIDLTDFFAYMHHSWINGGVVGPEVWSIHNEPRRRTTNDLEGYNNRLRNRLGLHNTLWKFLAKMKIEEDEVRVAVARQEGHMVVQDKKYAELNRRMREFKQLFDDGMLTPMAYLQCFDGVLPH